ncbi:YgfZ/GcvT domain-containing protein [Paeniglutamicibacter sp. NPDC091659]|uniref:CAF17-like 4Fe-4S cluster assembly/insertion protein YgfZ n=1 Tax=Paeniglutamicibacter sp. NPDC091659 TaxID=3364389 RepID=UPI0037F60784
MALSPLLSRPAAVAGSGVDEGVAAHYGELSAEQRRLLAGTAVADMSHFDVVTLAGEDRLSWLNTLSSQMLLELRPGQSTQTLLLTVQGRVEFDIRILADEDKLWLLVEPGQGAPLAAWLDRMRFMLRVEVKDVSADFGLVGACTPQPALEAYPCWVDSWPDISPGGYAYSVGEHPGAERPWREYILPLTELESAVADLPLAGMMAVEALRIAAWRPRFGFETDEKTIPHELDLVRTAVHLNKGCYKGQETVARVHNIGHPPRRIVFLHLDGSMHTLPAVGSEVRLGEKTIGKITSVATHFEAGPIALALIKRNIDPDAALQVVDGEEAYAASQETIVTTDAGQTAGRFTGFLRQPH